MEIMKYLVFLNGWGGFKFLVVGKVVVFIKVLNFGMEMIVIILEVVFIFGGRGGILGWGIGVGCIGC